MKFPIHRLDIDKYLDKIKNLLSDKECYFFIDTNVISQLYRLNDNARSDFYKWVEDCENRFFIPTWVIHEYSKIIYSKHTDEYFSELSKIKQYSKDFNNIADFINGYVGESLLRGSQYQDKVDDLKNDVEEVRSKLGSICTAITKNLPKHQDNVHNEIRAKLEPRVLQSNIYDLIETTECAHRYDNRIPPGFKDSNKEYNQIGDLIIWKEILAFCAQEKIKKAILISRDGKSDIVYEPNTQICDSGRPASNSERIKIVRESLPYEFKLQTGSDDFYVITFKTFVNIKAHIYRELAHSFQDVTANDRTVKDSCLSNIYSDDISNTSKANNKENQETTDYQPTSLPLYKGEALSDAQYDTESQSGCVDEYIDKLKSHNWYVQNPAINEITKIDSSRWKDNIEDRSSVFVLGRNILQSAEGSSASAISYMENFPKYIGKWDETFKKALIDGMLFEVFFNGEGKIRAYEFKATYFEELLRNIALCKVTNPYEFINDKLEKASNSRFVPTVGSDNKYHFIFNLDDKGNIESLKCNNSDITLLVTRGYGSVFSFVVSLNKTLSTYFAILMDNIEIEGINESIDTIYYKADSTELPF